MPVPAVEDNPVLCRQCGRQFNSFMYRKVTAGGEDAVSMVDRDGELIYDLVKVCRCGVVFHWHTKEQTIVKNSSVYQTAFEQLMSHYVSKDESAIITKTTETG